MMFRQYIYISLFCLVAANCSTEIGNPPQAPKANVLGHVAKGPITGTTLTAYSVDSDGTIIELLGEAVSNDEGDFEMAVTETDQAILFMIEGGNYSEEAGGTIVDVQISDDLTLLVDEIKENDNLAITALTHIAAERARTLMAEGETAKKAVRTANKAVATLFGLPNLKVKPNKPNNGNQNPNSDNTKYTLIQAGLSQYAANLSAGNALKLMRSLAKDFRDGEFDSLFDGETIVLEMGGNLPSQAVANGWRDAMAEFADSADNETGIDADDVDTMIGTIPAFD